eukprot:4495696-Pyramimonas_sp.AAC.1
MLWIGASRRAFSGVASRPRQGGNGRAPRRRPGSAAPDGTARTVTSWVQKWPGPQVDPHVLFFRCAGGPQSQLRVRGSAGEGGRQGNGAR